MSMEGDAVTGAEEGPYTIAINIDGPRDPQYVLELAEGFAGIARTLNHLTLSHEALEYPGEAHALIVSLASAVSRLPQLLGQVSGWLGQEQEAGRVRVPAGEYRGSPALAVAAARLMLDHAAVTAELLREALDAVSAVTCDLGAIETEGGRGDG